MNLKTRDVKDGIEVYLSLKKFENAELVTNNVIKTIGELERKYFDSARFEGNEVVICFKSIDGNPHKRVIAKQFSKKKYASCEEGMKKFSETKKDDGGFPHLNWEEKLRIEQKNYWLVIFEEI